MLRKTILIVLILVFLLPLFVFANNISVGTPTLTGQNTSEDYTFVQFDISWENSWLDGVNKDAAWVFVKYKPTSDVWKHATLNTSGHTAPTGSTIDTPSDGKGVFIYRSGVGTGTVTWNGVKLRWNYGSLADDATVTVKVFAIEMVYIPEGSFYVGDGTSSDIRGHFEAGTSGNPLQITDEGALTLGGGEAGSLGNNDAGGMTTADDFNDGTSRTLPADFPKGYNAFYCMKYEISQGQYCGFLNTLTSTQQDTRAYVYFDHYRNFIKKTNETPARFGCDANNNAGSETAAIWANLNESDDGEWVACNLLSWSDGCAYGDWAGLRPMTELEFEKVCRGAANALPDEYAWGSTDLTQAEGPVQNSGEANEVASTTGNGLCNCPGSGTGIYCPLRCGFAATSITTRISAGAGYYGVMELSGNLFERTVTVGHSTGRSFTGSHGDGALDSDGNANASDWPGIDAIGAGFRGGCCYYTGYLRVSDRWDAARVVTDRLKYSGFRLVSTE